MWKTDRWGVTKFAIKLFSLWSIKGSSIWFITLCTWTVGVYVLRKRRGKWVLESIQASEQLSAKGNFFLMPDWAQSPLCGRLEKGFLADFAPSLILTKYLLCITWQTLHPTKIFSRQGFEQFGAICVPFGWTWAMSHSAGPCWCIWDFATWLHRVLTYAVGATFHFKNTIIANSMWTAVAYANT